MSPILRLLSSLLLILLRRGGKPAPTPPVDHVAEPAAPRDLAGLDPADTAGCVPERYVPHAWRDRADPHEGAL